MKRQILFETIKTDLKSALLIFNKDSELVFANDRAYEILHLIGIEPIEFKEKVMQFDCNKVIERNEIKIDKYTVGYNLEKVNKNNKMDRVVIIFQDITNVKKKEKELKKKEQMEVLGELALYIAHEVKNSLNLIKGYSQLMLESEKIDFIHNNLGIFINETDRLNKLTHNILDYTKDNLVNLETIDIVKFTKEFVKQTYPNEGIDVISNEDVIDIRLDRDRMVQVYMNLIQNGLDAIETDGRFNIHIEGGEEKVEVTFETDARVEEDFDLAQLFNPYYTTKKDGNGLGLAICKKIMEEHNGTIEVYKNFYGGLSFVLEIPKMHNN